MEEFLYDEFKNFIVLLFVEELMICHFGQFEHFENVLTLFELFNPVYF